MRPLAWLSPALLLSRRSQRPSEWDLGGRLLEVGDHVGAVGGLFEAGKGHLRPRDVPARCRTCSEHRKAPARGPGPPPHSPRSLASARRPSPLPMRRTSWGSPDSRRACPRPRSRPCHGWPVCSCSRPQCPTCARRDRTGWDQSWKRHPAQSEGRVGGGQIKRGRLLDGRRGGGRTFSRVWQVAHFTLKIFAPAFASPSGTPCGQEDATMSAREGPRRQAMLARVETRPVAQHPSTPAPDQPA